MTWSPASAQVGTGRRKPHSPQNQSSEGRCRTPPQDGQDQASSFHSWPAATHTTVGQEEAAQVIRGSSALAITIASVPARPSRHFSASIRVSAARSSWSRDRLSRAIALGLTSLATPARYFSSTSMTPKRASDPPASAEVMPAGMLAPSALETTGPAALRASASSRVVVVLPLVAETSTTSRWVASAASRSGSSLRATRPPITDPLPRPAARDTAAAALPAVTASLARGDSGSELPAIVSTTSLCPIPAPARGSVADQPIDSPRPPSNEDLSVLLRDAPQRPAMPRNTARCRTGGRPRGRPREHLALYAGL